MLCFSDIMLHHFYHGGISPLGVDDLLDESFVAMPPLHMVINGIWFVNSESRKLKSEQPDSSCAKQEKQFYGKTNLKLATCLKTMKLEFFIITIMGLSRHIVSLLYCT